MSESSYYGFSHSQLHKTVFDRGQPNGNCSHSLVLFLRNHKWPNTTKKRVSTQLSERAIPFQSAKVVQGIHFLRSEKDRKKHDSVHCNSQIHL